MPYAVAPYSFVHPHHQIPTFGGPMPPHRVALPPPPPHMQMYHAAFPPHHPGHPQHPHHPPQATQPPAVQQYYAPQPTVTTVNVHPPPGTHHMFTIQQPMPVNVHEIFRKIVHFLFTIFVSFSSALMFFNFGFLNFVHFYF